MLLASTHNRSNTHTHTTFVKIIGPFWNDFVVGFPIYWKFSTFSVCTMDFWYIIMCTQNGVMECDRYELTVAAIWRGVRESLKKKKKKYSPKNMMISLFLQRHVNKKYYQFVARWTFFTFWVWLLAENSGTKFQFLTHTHTHTESFTATRNAVRAHLLYMYVQRTYNDINI